MAEHTPTPWRTFDNDQNATEIMGADGPTVAFAENAPGVRDADEAKANARLIVRAVNAHDALVDALKTAQTTIKELHDRVFPDGRFVYVGHSPEWRQIESALALAQKESK